VIAGRPELAKATLDEALGTEALLLGRPGDVVTEVSKLKQELTGEIQVPASFQLTRTLLEHDLVDELRLKIFPVVLGAGERLFGETSDKKPMRLINARILGDDIVLLTYEPVRDA
jgi:dihydrofolate reductase